MKKQLTKEEIRKIKARKQKRLDDKELVKK